MDHKHYLLNIQVFLVTKQEKIPTQIKSLK